MADVWYGSSGMSMVAFILYSMSARRIMLAFVQERCWLFSTMARVLTLPRLFFQVAVMAPLCYTDWMARVGCISSLPRNLGEGSGT